MQPYREKVLHAALLGADKRVPELDGAFISASKVFLVATFIIRNLIYAGIFVTKTISSFGLFIGSLTAEPG